MLNDLRFAVRSLSKTPGFTLIAVLTLAVGIGASASIFSALRALVLDAFSYGGADRVVQVWENEDGGMSVDDFFDMRAQMTSLADLGAYTPYPANVGGDKPETATALLCTNQVIESYGVAPLMGRTISAFDMEEGAPKVAVLSNGFWRQQFAGDPNVLGRKMRVDGSDATVIGVMPAGFDFASPWMRTQSCEFWTALKISPGMAGTSRGSRWLNAVGRLKEGASVADAEHELQAVGSRIAKEFPDTNSGDRFLLRSMKDEMTRYTSPAVWTLFGAVSLVMLVACANVASMLLARGAGRQAEIGVRMALGASRSQVIRLVVMDSLVLALASSALGALLAGLGVRLLALMASIPDDRRSTISLNWPVIFFCAGAAALTAILSALPPALAALGLSASEAARADSRSVAGSRGRSVMLRGLVVAQVAVAFALVNAGALVSASYLKELSANRLLATDRVLSAALDLNGSKYEKKQDAVRFCEQLAEKAATLPGVLAAGITTRMPLEGGNNMTIRRDDQPFEAGTHMPLAEIAAVTPGFFAASGIAILKGRTLNMGDAEGPMIGVVINKALADKEWPGRDPIGRVVMNNARIPDFKCRVVGVAEDVRQWGPRSEVNPAIYWPLAQAWGQQRFLVVRTAANARQLAGPARALVASMDPDLPLSQVRTLGDVILEDSKNDRVFAGIVDFFMATALCLVCVGLYGSLSYHVLRRTREIGVRLAVGAGRRNIVRIVISQGLGWVGIGLVIGVAASIALGAFMRSLVWGVAPVSVPALLGSAAVLAASAAAASWFPARRAAGLDPMTALRSD